jgi:hypothetical protein
LLDNLSDFDVDNFLLNVLSMLKDSGFGFSESINGLLALLDKFIDGKREPVVVLGSFVHMLLKSLDFTLHQFLFDGFQSTQCGVVASKKLIKLVNVSHVVFLLKSNVNDSLWDWLSDSFKELSFSDNDFKLWSKVNKVNLVLWIFFIFR